MSEDLIKRSDAIKAVKRISENYTGKGKRDYHPHVDFIIDELKYCVPSADRPSGKNLSADYPSLFECSECGQVSEASAAGILYKFCPFCGADMRGKDDES